MPTHRCNLPLRNAHRNHLMINRLPISNHPPLTNPRRPLNPIVNLPLHRNIVRSLDNPLLRNHLDLLRRNYLRDELSDVLDSIMVCSCHLPGNLLGPPPLLVLGYCFLPWDSFDPLISLVVNNLLFYWNVFYSAAGFGLGWGRDHLDCGYA